MSIVRIIEALLLLSVLVMIHELGHYTAGRLLGFTIVEYAVGMGPKLFGFKKKGIEYNVRALPLGGMCRFYGEDEGVADESKVLVLGVYENTPAAAAGLQEGDQFLSVDGKAVENFESLTGAVTAADAQHMEVVILRDGQEQKLTLSDLYNTETGANFMGVTLAYGVKRVGPFYAMKESVAVCWEYAGLVFKSLGMLFSGEAGLKDMAGPVGIVQLLGEATRSGWYTVLSLCTLLSVNLGLFNLFPIPALDGGRLLFILIEWVRGKPVPPEKEGVVHLVGFGLLMILVVVVTFNDILRLIRG